ncbi:GDP-mannose:cellobiosyl-diphosphopolyprenol alpha-mannosyltransferase [Posidoniimonas corsicana]|uniref:GDP-mannose:cellobiosyl-diphosphopolyprenol alpha-mannosyltransferase n=2 Tax=Posidoniimonas corsicana TaxID=1938618 RepID=A0A5C5VBG5_9BACT|nr:GDP-mannose:cellobiosyl-diphosphopolyprenol alpha-mannosyltransferase [Posidoniimonas corsicana]
MLSPWAMNFRRWKKSIAWWAFARRDLMEAALVHATSEMELAELRELGARQPIAMIPNGVEPLPLTEADAAPPSRPYVLFLSRVHRKKGIQELLEAWGGLAPQGWDLVIAGPDEEGILAKAKLQTGVRYIGSVEGEPKHRLLQQASLFVLPTYSENFGVVVAESLMAGVPVITTHGAPWRCLQTERCGWWIPMQPDVLRDTLHSAMRTPPDELRAMGLRGRAYVEQQFSWPEIARQMIDVYEWVLGGGPPPACVSTD